MDRHTAHERCSSAFSEEGVRWSVPLPAAGSGAAAEDEPAPCEERLALFAGRRSPLEEAAVATAESGKSAIRRARAASCTLACLVAAESEQAKRNDI